MSLVVVFAYIFLAGLLVSNVARLWFWILNRRQNRAFLEEAEVMMGKLGRRIEQRASDLQETFDVVNREYANLGREALDMAPPLKTPSERLARRRRRDVK